MRQKSCESTVVDIGFSAFRGHPDMSEQNGAQAPASVVSPEGEVLPHAQLDQIVATGISTDQTMASIRFKDPHGKEVVLSMAVEKLVSLQHLCAQMRQRLTRKGLPGDQVVMQFPRSWTVGSSDQQRNIVAVTFDEKLPSEAMYVLTDEAG